MPMVSAPTNSLLPIMHLKLHGLCPIIGVSITCQAHSAPASAVSSSGGGLLDCDLFEFMLEVFKPF